LSGLLSVDLFHFFLVYLLPDRANHGPAYHGLCCSLPASKIGLSFSYPKVSFDSPALVIMWCAVLLNVFPTV
jgi:hypothetical protein